MPILIIDLENTCMPESDRPSDYHGQIIEIGAAWVTPDGEVLDTFETFVQAENPVTEFCVELLGITQADVDGGLTFPEAMQALAEFAARHPNKTWASWGAADLNSLNHDCAHHGLESPLKDWDHRNLKKEWAKARRIKQVGMKKALEIAGIALEGPHHRALADVLNIAKLYADERSWPSLLALPKAAERGLNRENKVSYFRASESSPTTAGPETPTRRAYAQNPKTPHPDRSRGQGASMP